MPRAERSFRTDALILKRRAFGEADRLLTVLTPTHGKRQVIAKGARKPTSKKTGHVELFSRVDMLISLGRTFDIVAQAELRDAYLPLREDLTRGAYASYIAELTDRFTLDEDTEQNAVFDLLADSFTHLCEDDDSRLAVRYFEMHLLDHAGFRPELNHCVFTFEAVEPRDQFFSFSEGGVVSPNAAQYASAISPISLDALKLLRHMQRSPYSHVRTLTLADELHLEIEKIMLNTLTYLLESKLQSVDFIRRIRRLRNNL
jgi:DNA repair protein RecO (recombination protein O)